MLRTTAVSLLLVSLVSGLACSSESTDNKPGSAGSSGSGGSGGSGGTGRGGARTQAECDAAPVVCTDANTAHTCDSDTLMDVDIKCTEDFKDLGIVSNGCQGDAVKGGCSIDALSDKACEDGAMPFAVCANLTQEDVLRVYVACYSDNNGAHSVIPCYADYVDEMAMLVDCEAADAACLPTATGGTGAGGTGAGGGSGGGGTGGTGGSEPAPGGAGGDAP